MHSALVRVQNGFGFFTTVAFVVALLISLSVVISPRTPTADLKLRSVQVVKGRPHYYSSKREEYAIIKFDLDADLTSLFDWNTKQLFVYVQATYPSHKPNLPPSKAVIWDSIVASPTQERSLNPLVYLGLDEYWNRYRNKPVPRKRAGQKSGRSSSHGAASTSGKTTAKPGKLSLSNVKPKYQITDISGKMAERGNVTLELGWNIQPWVGALTWARPTKLGLWLGLQGGSSAAFDFPALKGKKPEIVKGTSSDDVTQKEAVPKAAEASPVL